MWLSFVQDSPLLYATKAKKNFKKMKQFMKVLDNFMICFGKRKFKKYNSWKVLDNFMPSVSEIATVVSRTKRGHKASQAISLFEEVRIMCS